MLQKRLAVGPAAAVAALVVLGGCAGTSGWPYAESPGVPAAVELAGGDRLSGSLVGYDGEAFIFEHAVPKSPRTEVVRRDGRDVVVVAGVPVGTAVEVRDFDIVVRERLARWEVEETTVGVGAYFGWGTGVAAGLGFLLVQLLEEL